MEQDEPADVLYDYLYKDSNRIDSYYAQLFAGRLASMEATDTERRTTDGTLKGNAGVVALDGHVLKESQTSSKNVVDPHDMATSDVLAHFADNGRIAENVESAPHGAIVMAKGTVFFLHSTFTDVAMMAAKASMKPPKTATERQEALGMKMAEQILAKAPPPSAFVLETGSNIQVCGTVKDEGMQESITSYYYRHGHGGLSDVYVIGVKEMSSEVTPTQEGSMVSAGRPVAAAFQALLLPAGGIKVTPIAIFRKLF